MGTIHLTCTRSTAKEWSNMYGIQGDSVLPAGPSCHLIHWREFHFLSTQADLQRKKGHCRKIKWIISQNPSSCWHGLYNNSLSPEATEQEPTHLWFPIFLTPLPLAQPTAHHTGLWPSPWHMFPIYFNYVGCFCLQCSVSWLHKILTLHDPRWLPLTHSPHHICRAKILGTAPAIINVLNRCSKMTKRVISAVEENAEVKREQR